MKVEINAIGFAMTDALEEYTRRRLRFALGTQSQYLKCVVVRLSDINGPRGGHDKSCHIQIVLPGFPDLVVEDTATDLYIAISRAAARANRSVTRRLKRRQTRSAGISPSVYRLRDEVQQG